MMQARTLPRCREMSGKLWPVLLNGCAAVLASTLLLLPALHAHAADAEGPRAQQSDPRIIFETAGQLFVELQTKPPAMRMRADYTRVVEAYRNVYHVAPTSL